MTEENLGTAVLSIVVDSKGLEESLNKAKQQIQKTSRDLQRSLTQAPINPATGRVARSERSQLIKTAIQQRRADQRALQTASGSGLGRFLRDARAREEAEKRINAERQKGFEQGFRKGGARESINALTDAQKRRYSLERQISSLEAGGVNTAKLRAQLGEATTAQANRQFGSFNRIADALNFTLRKERDKLKIIQEQNRELEQQARRGGASEPIRGRVGLPGSPADITFLARQGGARSPVGGTVGIPGSPAFLAAQKTAGEAQARAFSAEVARLARQGGARSPVGGAVDIPGSPAFLAAQRRFELAELSKAARFGGPRSPLGGSVNIPGSPAAIRAEEALAQAREKSAQAAQKATQAEGRRIGGLNAAPVRGGKAFPGSPAFLDSIFPSFPKEYFAKQAREVKAASQKQQGIISNAIIGGAFPLLFGQGIGASIGGAAGGAAGGAIGGQFGFGLSLVGTALGSQFDIAIQKSGELAKALDNPIAQFGALQQNALLSSKGLEKQIQSLIASGREAEAAALIQEDLNKLFGDAEGAKEYQNAVDRLNRSYSQATVTLTNFVAGPLADFLERIAGPTRNTQLSARIISEKATLDPQQRKQFAAFAAEERRKQNLGPLPSSLQVTELYVALLGEINRLQAKNNTALATAARNQKILTQSAQTLVGLEASINRARISGNKPLEESITLQQELLKNYRERKNIEQQLAAKQITSAQATERTRQSFEKDTALQQNYVNSTRQSAANAVKELQTTKQLSGLEGVRLEVARKRLEIDDAANAAFLQRTEFINARERLSAQPTDLNKVLAQGAFQELATAGVQFETKLRQAADYLVKAAKDAAQNLTTAILNLGKLEADPAGLNRFLTPNEQFESTRKAILRLGTGADGSSQLENAITKATELLGLTRGQANERFQGLRDIFAQARQGVFASQEGFNTLSSFIEDTRAREQAVTGLDDAQKTLTDVTALSASVQQELVGAVKENSVLLNSLFGKDWNVNVSVSGAEANVSGDAINRQLSP